MDKRPTLAMVLVAAMIMIGVLMVHAGEYDDQRADQDRYCDMVRSGAWPDYRETFEEEC